MTAALAPGLLHTALPGYVDRGLPDTPPSRPARCPVLAYPEQAALDPGSGSFDGLLLCQGEFFPEHAPRHMVGHHEREGNGLTDWEPEGGALADRMISSRRSRRHTRISRTCARTSGSSNSSSVVSAAPCCSYMSNRTATNCRRRSAGSPVSGISSCSVSRNACNNSAWTALEEVLACGEVVVDRSGGGVRPLGDHVHRQAVCTHLPEHLDRSSIRRRRRRAATSLRMSIEYLRGMNFILHAGVLASNSREQKHTYVRASKRINIRRFP